MTSAEQTDGLASSETDGAKLTAMVGVQLEFLTRTDEPGHDVTRSDILLTCISIVLRIVSISLTLFLAYEYYRDERINYFALTLGGLIVPAIITSLLSLLMYVDDTKRGGASLNPAATPSCAYLCFRFSAKRRQDWTGQKRTYELLVQEDSDVALLRIFECLLEVTLQKILQLTIVLSTGPVSLLQMLSIISAMGSIAWCMASHYRCVRFARLDKRHIPWSGTIVHIAWQFTVTVARVLAIATVASVFPYYTALACAVHAMLMALWVFFYERPSFCGDSFIQRAFLSFAFGAVFIFNYIPLREGATRLRYSLFYTVCFGETVACATLYALFVRNPTIRGSPMWLAVLSCFPVVMFVLGIALMIVFYRSCHPNITSRQQDDPSVDI
ncbi:AGAP000599-PA-like protein [Anopheles sinensis]|uniref:XK-related protein n=1 Tax=Anopheles sinensis TaxID=74873 RepID=A0A084VV32_ANOSI|nr:AGAP000599-PA-like protein [Anopheles sinensis]